MRRGWSSKPWTKLNAVENVILHPDRLSLPLRWKEPRRVFVDSMSDLFHEEIPEEYIHKVFTVMRASPRHIFQILTKRPVRLLDVMTHLSWMTHPEGKGGYIAYRGQPGAHVLHNVWLGVSVEDQRRADERIPLLLQAPAAVRFLSCEPLLGPLDLGRYVVSCPSCGVPHLGNCDDPRPLISWVIVGGESGPGYRPMDLDWARSLQRQSQAADVAFFFKQSAAPRPGSGVELDGHLWHEFPQQRETGESTRTTKGVHDGP